MLCAQPDARPKALPTGLQARAALPLADFDVRWRTAAGKADVPLPVRNAGGAGPALPDGVEVEWNHLGLARMVSHTDGALTGPESGDAARIARRFIAGHPRYFQLSGAGADRLQILREADRGAIRLVDFRQTVDGIPVFGGELRVALDAEGRVIQASAGDLAPDLAEVEEFRLGAAGALAAALRLMRQDGNAAAGARRVERVIFPLSAAAGRPGYRIILDTGNGALFDLVVDAVSGALLYRRNLVEHGAQARVWTRSPLAGERELIDLSDGWLPADATVTRGNNADAFLDAGGDLAPDPVSGQDLEEGRAMSPGRVFDFPASEGSRGGDPAQFPSAAVTNAFYLVNEAHDYYYRLGFDEASGNFQADNFGRGGEGGDAVPVAVQSGLALNNAFFGTPPDGIPPRMALGISTLFTDDPTDDRDTAYSAQVIFHEYGHGVTHRLIGGPEVADCLSGIQSNGLGEGWSDYFAISHTNDPVLGAYFLDNMERGIRRHSYEGYPLTYEHISNGRFIDPHADGEIWAAALWALRTELGPQTTDQLVMNGIQLTQCRPSMVDARDAILRADEVLSDRAHWPQIWESFARFGLGASASGQDGAIAIPSVFNAAYDLPSEAAAVNHTPVIGSVPPLGEGVGQPYVYRVDAADADGDALTYELLDGPEGMSVDAETGALHGSGSFVSSRASIRVSDGAGGEVVHGFTMPMWTDLAPGAPVTIEGGFRTEGYAGIEVPPGAEILQVTLRGGEGRAGLGIRSPLGVDRSSTLKGQSQTLTVADPDPGSWGISVFGLASYSGVALEASLPAPREISPGEPIDGLAGETTSETFFRVQVPPGTELLRIRTSGGTGDVDLQVRRLGIATCPLHSAVMGDCLVDETSYHEGTDEHVDVVLPAAGEWNITLYGYDAYTGVTLSAEIFAAGETVPQINTGGVMLATQSPISHTISPLALATIYGRDFTPAGVEALSPRIDEAGRIATELAGVCVEIGGKRAPVLAVTPTQINFQAPDNLEPGRAEVVIIRACGSDREIPSEPASVWVAEVSPAFFNFVNTIHGANPVAALHGGGPSLVGEPGILPGADTSPAAPGEYISLFGTGFGPTDPPLAAGEIPLRELPNADGQARLAGPVTFRIGDTTLPPEDIYYAGAAPCCAGLYQFIVKVPGDAPSGNLAVTAIVGGEATRPGPYVTVQRE